MADIAGDLLSDIIENFISQTWEEAEIQAKLGAYLSLVWSESKSDRTIFVSLSGF